MLRSLALVAVLASSAGAETRGVLRMQVLPLSLTPSSETPLFGGEIDRAVSKYNRAASARGESMIDASSVELDETLFVFAPGIEADHGHYLFRIEAPVGFADDLASYGLGLYPLGAQTAIGRDVVLYGSAGGTASWLDRPGDGDRGALLTARAAIGARVAKHVLAEVGYSAYAIGGTVNTTKLDEMSGAAPLPDPATVVTAGSARNFLDVSFGVTF